MRSACLVSWALGATVAFGVRSNLAFGDRNHVAFGGGSHGGGGLPSSPPSGRAVAGNAETEPGKLVAMLADQDPAKRKQGGEELRRRLNDMRGAEAAVRALRAGLRRANEAKDERWKVRIEQILVRTDLESANPCEAVMNHLWREQLNPSVRAFVRTVRALAFERPVLHRAVLAVRERILKDDRVEDSPRWRAAVTADYRREMMRVLGAHVKVLEVRPPDKVTIVDRISAYFELPLVVEVDGVPVTLITRYDGHYDSQKRTLTGGEFVTYAQVATKAFPPLTVRKLFTPGQIAANRFNDTSASVPFGTLATLSEAGEVHENRFQLSVEDEWAAAYFDKLIPHRQLAKRTWVRRCEPRRFSGERIRS